MVSGRGTCQVLHPFEVAKTVMSAENIVPLSCVLPIMDGFTKSVSPSNGDLPAIASFKAIAKKELEE